MKYHADLTFIGLSLEMSEKNNEITCSLPCRQYAPGLIASKISPAFCTFDAPSKTNVLPMHKAILVYRRKYTLKYPNGLITWAYRHWLDADGFQLHTEQYLSSDIVLSPLQDLLTKRGHVRLTVWL